jgi:hypothetical protein
VKVAGLDISSYAVDLVLLDEETDAATWQRFSLAGATPFERTRTLRDVFPTRYFWEEHGVYLFAVEDPHSRFPHAAKAMGLVTGGVAALLPREAVVVQTAPKEWKRIFTGNANATKDAVAERAIDLWTESGAPVPYCDGEDDNTWDAYGIAWAVRKLNDDAIQRGAA